LSRAKVAPDSPAKDLADASATEAEDKVLEAEAAAELARIDKEAIDAKADEAKRVAEAAQTLTAAQAVIAGQEAVIEREVEKEVVREADNLELDPLKQDMLIALNDTTTKRIVRNNNVARAISGIVRIVGENGTTPQEQIETILDLLTGTDENPSLSNYDYFDFKDQRLFFNAKFFQDNKTIKVDPAKVIQGALEQDRNKTFNTMNFLKELICVDTSKFDGASQERILDKLYNFFLGILKGRHPGLLRDFFAPPPVEAPVPAPDTTPAAAPVPTPPAKKPSVLGRVRGWFGKKTKGGSRKKSSASSSRIRSRTSRKVRSK
jgi:hypothetical protein